MMSPSYSIYIYIPEEIVEYESVADITMIAIYLDVIMKTGFMTKQSIIFVITISTIQGNLNHY